MEEYGSESYFSGYVESLHAAGAIVHEFCAFGDYTGTYLALVTYNGETFFLRNYFGSCRYCDSYQAMLDYGEPTPEKLREFGKQLLNDSERIQLANARGWAKKQDNWEWDNEAEEVDTWLNKVLDNFN